VRWFRLIIVILFAIIFHSCDKEPDILCPCETESPGRLCREYHYAGSEYAGHVDYGYTTDGLISEKRFFSSDDLGKIIRCEYTSTKKLLKESVFDGNENLQSYCTYTYNAFDSIDSQTYFENDAAVSRISYEYGNNKLLETRTSYVKETLTGRMRFTYDGRGSLYRIEELDASGTILSFRLYNFYSNNVIRIEYYDQAGEYQGYDIKTSDQDGRIQQHSSYDEANKLKWYITYIYNGNLLIKRSEFQGNGKIKSYTLFQYS
jgi:hypothetical protein